MFIPARYLDFYDIHNILRFNDQRMYNKDCLKRAIYLHSRSNKPKLNFKRGRKCLVHQK